MLSLLLTLLPSANAAEIQVATLVPINILVDGVPISWDEDTGLGVVTDVPEGLHRIEARTLFGKTIVSKEVELASDEQARFEYRKKKLNYIGTYKIATTALPPSSMPTGPVSTTTVVETQEQVVSPGVGIVISDGYDTVSVGAGGFGSGIIVSDGYGSGVIVDVPVGGATTTTTTTTTTVVTTSGDLPPPVVDTYVPIPVEPMGMDPGAFGELRSQIDKASFSDDKLSVLRTAVDNNGLTCRQLAQLLDAFDFAGDKLEAVGIARASVVDPQNAFVLNDKFSFSSDAKKAQAYFR